MATRSAPSTAAFVPRAASRVLVTTDGALAALHAPDRISMIDTSACALLAEVEPDPAAIGVEVGWLSSPSRLLVVSRLADATTLHAIDPFGAQAPLEARLDADARLLAIAGNHALVLAPSGPIVASATDHRLVVHPFPTRTVPVAAGAAGQLVVVASASGVEEWDLATRMPRRRIRVARPAATGQIAMLGGSPRVVWVVGSDQPRVIEVSPLVNRGQPKFHELPEPIAIVASHPDSDVLACVGASHAHLYIVDLDGPARPVRTIELDGGELVGDAPRAGYDGIGLVVGRILGALVAQTDQPVWLIPLDGSPIPARRPAPVAVAVAAAAAVAVPELPAAPAVDAGASASSPSSEAAGEADAAGHARAKAERDAQRAAAIADAVRARRARESGEGADEPVAAGAAEPANVGEPSAAARAADDADDDASELARDPLWFPDYSTLPPSRISVGPIVALAAVAAAAAQPTGTLAASRAAPTMLGDRFARNRPAVPPVRARDRLAVQPDARPSWRDELVGWARAVEAGSLERAAPTAMAIEPLLARFELPPQLAPVIALLYAQHLRGVRGAPPYDVARVLGRRWDEALGKGLLARRGVTVHRDSRIALAPVILRYLDELPPATGVVVGEPGIVSLLGPCVVVGAGELAAVAARYADAIGGAVLAAYDGAPPSEVLLEARAIGAAAMVRASGYRPQRGELVVVVAADDDTANQLGWPRLG